MREECGRTCRRTLKERTVVGLPCSSGDRRQRYFCEKEPAKAPDCRIVRNCLSSALPDNRSDTLETAAVSLLQKCRASPRCAGTAYRLRKTGQAESLSIDGVVPGDTQRLQRSTTCSPRKRYTTVYLVKKLISPGSNGPKGNERRCRSR